MIDEPSGADDAKKKKKRMSIRYVWTCSFVFGCSICVFVLLQRAEGSENPFGRGALQCQLEASDQMSELCSQMVGSKSDEGVGRFLFVLFVSQFWVQGLAKKRSKRHKLCLELLETEITYVQKLGGF
jgi:hypothetical protein